MMADTTDGGEITRVYYHVTDRPWDGEALVPYSDCANDCIELDEYERGVDGDVVCLYETLAEARAHLDCVTPNGSILAITVVYDPTEGHIYNMPDYGGGLRVVTVPEGYKAINGWVPPSAIKVIS